MPCGRVGEREVWTAPSLALIGRTAGGRLAVVATAVWCVVCASIPQLSGCPRVVETERGRDDHHGVPAALLPATVPRDRGSDHGPGRLRTTLADGRPLSAVRGQSFLGFFFF